MTKLAILAAILAAGAAQAVPPVGDPAQSAARPQQPTATAAAAAPRKIPGVSDDGNAIIAKAQAAPDPQLQALAKQGRAAHDQLMSAAMAPTVDADKVAAAMKAENDVQTQIRDRATERLVSVLKQLSNDDRGTFVRVLILSRQQRPGAPAQQPAPASPQP